MGVYRVLSSLIHILSGQNVEWFTDNQAVTSMHKGSLKSDLQVIAIDIFKLCLAHSIQLQIEWVPRSENDRADYLSKLVETDDRGISFELLDLIVQKWGELQVDRLASDHMRSSRFFIQNSGIIIRLE